MSRSQYRQYRCGDWGWIVNDNLANELLRGARAIAAFYYGDERHARRIFHLVDKGRFPHFREGNVICARKSTILAWVAEQEERSITAARAA
jgi:hypothetical protein